MAKVFKILVGSILITIASASHAHHGSNGQFDTAKKMSVTGKITDIRFVNPHSYVYFDVTNEKGTVEEWRCELTSGSLLKRRGWTTSMFETGEVISIDGHPARREPHGCMAQSLKFANGQVIARNDSMNKDAVVADTTAEASYDQATIFGSWVAERRARPPRPPADAAGAGPGEGATPGRGTGRRGPPRGPQYSQSELSKTAGEGFDREDNPRFHCEATNIFMDWTFDQHVNTIEQAGDNIVMNYGFMDIDRTIHMGQNKHPNDIVASRAGHSIGSWDGGTLVVDTVGFAPGYLQATFAGVRHGDKMHVVERFSLSDDGKTLNRDYTVEDPEYLSAAFEGKDSVVATTAAFDEYQCEDLTEERVEGF